MTPRFTQGFVDQEPTFSDSIIASGVLATDASMASVLNNGGTLGTTRFYNPLDPDKDAPLVRDGDTDNEPTTISGGKQSFIRLDRMKAWKATQLTRELTAADPMAYVARSTSLYWRMYWQGLMVKMVDAVLTLSGLSTPRHHRHRRCGRRPGDRRPAGSPGRPFAPSLACTLSTARYTPNTRSWGLIDYNKYTITNVLQKEVELPTINGLIVIKNDRGTYDGSTNYTNYLFGQGSILTATPKVITPDYTDYDAKTDGGTDILYNNRSIILHPNGVSFKADGITKETPTDTEFTTSANWDLRFDAKNVRLAKIVIPAAQLTPGE